MFWFFLSRRQGFVGKGEGGMAIFELLGVLAATGSGEGGAGRGRFDGMAILDSWESWLQPAVARAGAG